MGVLTPDGDLSPIRLAGGITLTDEVSEPSRDVLGLRGRKLDVICRDCGGAGGSKAVCGESLNVDGGGEAVGVGMPGASDESWE